MDTPDKANCLADSQLADSCNKGWLLASARSNQLLASTRLDLSLSSDCTTHNYGTIGGWSHEGAIARFDNEPPAGPSWLARSCPAQSWPKCSLQHQPIMPKNLTSAKFTINNHIYDNISLADSPILHQTFAHKLSHNSCSASSNKSHQQQCRIAFSTSYSGLFEGKFRYFLACYVLIGITVAIYSRNALSLAAVDMIANNALNRELTSILSKSASTADYVGASQLDGACPIPISATPSTGYQKSIPIQASLNISLLESNLRSSIGQKVARGELVAWTPSQQGLVFAAGSVGNLLIAIPLTRLGEIYGPKWVIFVATFGATIQAALMPVVSPCNIVLVIIFQVVFNGLTYGIDCVAYTLFAHWLTPTEMAFFVSCLLICYQMGTILSSFANAKILSSNCHWDWCFYTPAILCAVWTLIWVIIGASTPSNCRLISRAELHYLLRHSKITQTLRGPETSNVQADAQGVSSSVDSVQQDQKHSISWLKLAKDPNIWAICAVKFTLRWYFSVYLSLMPTYLSTVAHMSVETIGKMSAFQSFIGLFSGIIMGYLTKSLVIERPFNMSLAAMRKFFQSIVNFGLVISLIAFISYDCNQWVTIVALTVGGICINFYVAAALQLPLDLSSEHCGLITSITNTLAFGQTLGAPISGLILNDDPKDRSLWRAVWLLAIILNLLSGIIFILLVDSKPRDYSKRVSPSAHDEGADKELIPRRD